MRWTVFAFGCVFLPLLGVAIGRYLRRRRRAEETHPILRGLPLQRWLDEDDDSERP